MQFWKALIILLLAWVSVQPGYSQPKGTFLAKSINIGSQVQYALSYRHSPAQDVFFPDSTYDFSPFQLIKREYFPTTTNARGSLDSVVYTLVSFEIDHVQALKLPVYMLSGTDCTAVYAPVQKVVLNSLVNPREKGAALKANITPVFLKTQVNYPLYLLILLLAAILSGLVYWLFGDSINRRWKQFQLWRRYLEFRSTYQRYLRGATDSKQAVLNVERAVFVWKRYLERLENKPYTTFTTKEAVEQFPQESMLEQALRETDAVVYGGVASPQTQESLRILRELASRTYIVYRRKALSS